MEEIRVDLGERSYGIFIGSGIMPELGEKIRPFKFSRVAMITNPMVYSLYGNAVTESLKKAGFDAPVVIVPDGEEYKDLERMSAIYGELLGNKLDRSAAIIALGGGVIGDMAGFAASTYMRGIAFIQVPTTLLAQVDSSVGGKTGVNHPLGKNMIGTFYQPRLVWADVAALRTLPRDEFLAGIAEVIKYGVIWDEELFRFLEDRREDIMGLKEEALGYIIRRSCQIKAEVVSMDEREGGLRAILNYGHTVGHAVETVTGYKQFLHGEAVAVGMHIEARLSMLLGLISGREVERIRSLIRDYDLPAEMPENVRLGDIVASMQLDKKAVAGELKFILPEKIGTVRIAGVGDREKIVEAMRAK